MKQFAIRDRLKDLRNNKKAIISFFANCFFYCFVFSIPLTYLDFGGVHSYTYIIPFFVSLVGIPIATIYSIFIDKNHLISKDIVLFFLAIVYLVIQSLISSVISNITLGVFYGNHPLLTGAKETLYIFHALILIVYSRIMIKIADPTKILISFIGGFSIFLFFGYVQICFTYGLKFLGSLIDFLSKLKLSHSSAYFDTYNKICATTPEAAHMTQIIICFFLPTSLCFISKYKKTKASVLLVVFLLLLIPIIIASHSTELILTIGFVLSGVVVFFIVKMFKRKDFLPAIIVIFILISSFLILFFTDYFQTYVMNKIFGNFAYSAQKRFSHIYNSLVVFIKNPGFGVGSGIGGYFYQENIVDTWFINSSEVRYFVIGTNGIPTAAPFVFYFLSSYGLFGCSVFCIGIAHFMKPINKSLNKRYFLFFLIGICGFVFISLFVENIIGSYYLSFLLSLPLLFNKKYSCYLEVTI